MEIDFIDENKNNTFICSNVNKIIFDTYFIDVNGKESNGEDYFLRVFYHEFTKAVIKWRR